MNISFRTRYSVIACVGVFLLAGCGAKPEVGAEGTTSPAAGSAAKGASIPPQMSQEAARVSAEASAQAAGRAAAAGQQPR